VQVQNVEILVLFAYKDPSVSDLACNMFTRHHFDGLLARPLWWEATRIFVIVCSHLGRRGLVGSTEMLEMFYDKLNTCLEDRGASSTLYEPDAPADERDRSVCALVTKTMFLDIITRPREKPQPLIARFNLRQIHEDISWLLKQLYQGPCAPPRGRYYEIWNTCLIRLDESQKSGVVRPPASNSNGRGWPPSSSNVRSGLQPERPGSAAPLIQVQYASFADKTPSYSAGSLTNSSWSYAPLNSLDGAANLPSYNAQPTRRPNLAPLHPAGYRTLYNENPDGDIIEKEYEAEAGGHEVFPFSVVENSTIRHLVKCPSLKQKIEFISTHPDLWSKNEPLYRQLMTECVQFRKRNKLQASASCRHSLGLLRIISVQKTSELRSGKFFEKLKDHKSQPHQDFLTRSKELEDHIEEVASKSLLIRSPRNTADAGKDTQHRKGLPDATVSISDERRELDFRDKLRFGQNSFGDDSSIAAIPAPESTSKTAPSVAERAARTGYANMEHIDWSTLPVEQMLASDPHDLAYNESTRDTILRTHRVRRSRFFKPGKVFCIFTKKSLGKSRDKTRADSALFGKDGQDFYLHQMVVVRKMSEMSWCVGIDTSKDDDAAAPRSSGLHSPMFAHDSRRGASSIQAGDPMEEKQVVAIQMAPTSPSLDIPGRLSFDLVYAVSHNMKVREVGQVAPKDLPVLLAYVRAEHGLL